MSGSKRPLPGSSIGASPWLDAWTNTEAKATIVSASETFEASCLRERRVSASLMIKGCGWS